MRAGVANPAKKSRIGSVPSRISSDRAKGYRDASGLERKPEEK